MVCIPQFEQEVFLLVENILVVLVNYTNVIFDLYQNPVDLPARRNLSLRFQSQFLLTSSTFSRRNGRHLALV